MCGFVGVFASTGLKESDREALRRAGKRLSHRGPDDSGEYFDENAGIFFNRLSILDLTAAGHQPMISSDGRYVLALNGEIYNFKELRQKLESRGQIFKTRSDTEVLLKAYGVFGAGCVDELRGMFSFLVWDRKERTLAAFRDRMGIKPLYFYENASYVLFASEIKAILEFAPDAKEWDEATIFKYLSRGWVDDSSDTFFMRIKAVPPAYQISVSSKGIRRHRYWTLCMPGNRAFNEEEFRAGLLETVSLHLRSDVPVAATLSGGMDSSSVVAAALEVSRGKASLRAFSVIPEKTLDESPWIDRIVRHTGVAHSYLDIPRTDISARIGRSLRMHDEPYQGSSCFYQYLLRAEIASCGIKVLLVGEGGDEVLGGYRRLLYPYLLSLESAGRVKEFQRSLAGASAFMEIPEDAISRNMRAYRDTVSEARSGQENTAAYSLLSEDFKLRHQATLDEPYYPKKSESSENLFFTQLYQHLFTRDIPYVLRMEDRNSMAHGIEARVPFLDHRFMEQVFSYDFAEFMRDGRNKSMLRRAMRGLLPDEVTNRWSKSPRPGNNAHLMYEVLLDEMRDRLRGPDLLSFPYWRRSMAENFEQDAASGDPSRAEAWFRVYLFGRWASEAQSLQEAGR